MNASRFWVFWFLLEKEDNKYIIWFIIQGVYILRKECNEKKLLDIRK